jgi:hypothetical protein
LKRELKAKQVELDALRSTRSEPASAMNAAAAGAAPGDESAAGTSMARSSSQDARMPDGAMPGAAALAAHPWLWILALLAALACAFWLGYATLARRVRDKFGGIKVY